MPESNNQIPARWAAEAMIQAAMRMNALAELISAAEFQLETAKCNFEKLKEKVDSIFR